MKNKLLKISILTIIFVMLLQVVSFAALGKLTLTTKTDKDSYEVGEKVTVTIDWTEEVESAGFTLTYDKDKLSFDSTTLGPNYYNAETEGEILFNWASMEGNKFTKVSFVFVAKAEGTSTISIQDARGFGIIKDGKAEKWDEYEYNNKTIKIEKKQEQQKVTLESISITKTPTKNTYLEGEKFETKGMEVTAKYSDGSTKVVTNYTYSPAEELKIGDDKVVITYTENGVTKTAEQKITVLPYAAGTGSNEGEPDNNQQPDTNEQPDNTQKTDNDKQPDNTTAGGKLPQAGLETKELLPIVLFAVVAIVGFRGYRKLSDI